MFNVLTSTNSVNNLTALKLNFKISELEITAVKLFLL